MMGLFGKKKEKPEKEQKLEAKAMKREAFAERARELI